MHTPTPRIALEADQIETHGTGPQSVKSNGLFKVKPDQDTDVSHVLPLMPALSLLDQTVSPEHIMSYLGGVRLTGQ